MNILMISSYLPYPLHSGGQVRLYNLIKELSAKHTITLICEKRPHQTEEDVQEMKKLCKKVVTVPRRKQWSVQNIARAGTTLRSFLSIGHKDPKMRQLIMDELVRENYDLIHVETFYVMQNVPETAVPIVLVDHNIEYFVYQRFVKRASVALRPLLLLDIAKMKREEEKAWKRATRVVAVSEEDRKIMKQKGIDAALVSNGVNIEQFSFKDKSIRLRQGSGGQRKILFIGDFRWIQNQDTVRFILQDIWPQIIAKSEWQMENSRYVLWIVGRTIPDSLKSVTDDPDVLFDEESSKKATPGIFQEAALLLAPIRVGGGTSYKILESMSCGTPVVTMPMSADAIHAKDEVHIMVGKNAEELAEKTVKLLTDQKLYDNLAKGGRKLIEERYSWKEIAKDLEAAYKHAILNA